MLEVIKSLWHSWVVLVIPEKVYNAGIVVAVIVSIVCFIVMAVMLRGRKLEKDSGIAIKKYNKKKVLA